MIRLLRSNLSKALAVAAFAFAAFMWSGDLQSQPTNYCNTCQLAGWNNYCYTWSYAWPKEVHLQDAADGSTSLRRTSGFDRSYIFTKVEGSVILGNRYKMTVKVGHRYNYINWRYHCRVYIDWNQDGDFFDTTPIKETILPAVPNVPPWWITWRGGADPTWVFYFNVDVNAPPGKTRMRVFGSYYSYNYGPCHNGYRTGNRNYAYYGEAEDYILSVEGGVKDTYPSLNTIIIADEWYNGQTRLYNGVDTYFQKPTIYFNSDQKSGAKVNYYIYGPLPSLSKVYEGLDPSGGSTDIDVSGVKEYELQAAQGVFSNPNGDFKANRGGTYICYAFLKGSPTPKKQAFFVSWDDDLSMTEIISPRSCAAPRFFKYPQGLTIRVKGKFQNVGLNNVSEFYGICSISNSDGDRIYRDSIYYSAPDDGAELATGDSRELDFRSIRLTEAGKYSVQICATLLSGTDQDAYNDCVPRSDGAAYEFEIAYEIQLVANQIFRPGQGDLILGNRPLIPMAEFKNLGVGDASDIPAQMLVYKLPDLVNPVYTSNIIVQDIQGGQYNTKTDFFAKMTLRETGDYKACIIITSEEDPVRDDDTLCITFSVEGGLQGVYTVGVGQDFPTIDSMMNALYYRGVAGSVIFEFTDAVYDLYSFMDGPAWDFSTRIINLGYDEQLDRYNTITFRPARNRAYTRGGVTFNLYTENGKGVYFGQSYSPANNYAIFHQFGTEENANFPGYVTFDGGSQNAFKFVLHSESDVHGAAFFLGNGAHDIAIKNCIIEDNSTSDISCNTHIPLVLYHPQLGYTYQKDIFEDAGNNYSYSAGVAIRNTLTKFGDEEIYLKFDTIPNSNNVVEGNDISGFGYGVMSIGLGPLWMTNQAYYKRFYNENNSIKNNVIYDVCRAGIFLGYEENSDIVGNRIYDVGSSGVEDAAGIIAGGESRGDLDGYNNINLRINGNEISGVAATDVVAGILVEQVRVSYQDPRGGEVYFPDAPENMVLMNNVVWGLEPSSDAASKVGIALFTERDPDAGDWEAQRITPENPDYFTRNDKIANNTILIGEDGGMFNTAVIAGVSIQQADNMLFYNNAIAITDASIDPTSPVTAAVFYQGIKPDLLGGINSDRNAFWLGSSGGSLFRFIEIDRNSNIFDYGTRNEFPTLDQWQYWTGADHHTSIANFTQDLIYTGADPYKLRINLIPQPPLGSLLNNGGDRLDFVTVDIDGNTRGPAGQRYDIGAFEFDGRMYISDVEAINIPAPGAYMAGTGDFSDAQYNDNITGRSNLTPAK